MPTPDRVRITISLSKEVADQIDKTIDGIRIRNRSHAVESLVTDSLQISQVRHAVVLAGGEHVTRKLPAIRHMLQTLSKSGILDVIVAVGYLGDSIRKELGDGSQHGVKISYHQTELGTGGALAELKAILKQTFIVVNLSEPVNVDIRTLLQFHREHNPVVTLATKHLGNLDGVYVIEPKVFATIPSGFCMLEDNVFPELTKQGKLLPYPVLQPISNRS
jgi:Arc/MetJ-type ribon-helix-helix transcriptional regulator